MHCVTWFADSSPVHHFPHPYLCLRPRNKYWGSHLQSQVLKVPLTNHILYRHPVAGKSKCEHFSTTLHNTQKVLCNVSVNPEGAGRAPCPQKHLLSLGPGNYRPVSLTLILRKVVEQTVLEIIFKHTKYKIVTKRSQHRFTKGKSLLINLTATHGTITSSVSWGISTVYLDLCKSFDTVSPSSLMYKLIKYGVVKWGEPKTDWTDRLGGLLSAAQSPADDWSLME